MLSNLNTELNRPMHIWATQPDPVRLKVPNRKTGGCDYIPGIVAGLIVGGPCGCATLHLIASTAVPTRYWVAIYRRSGGVDGFEFDAYADTEIDPSTVPADIRANAADPVYRLR